MTHYLEFMATPSAPHLGYCRMVREERGVQSILWGWRRNTYPNALSDAQREGAVFREVGETLGAQKARLHREGCARLDAAKRLLAKAMLNQNMDDSDIAWQDCVDSVESFCKRHPHQSFDQMEALLWMEAENYARL